MLLFPLHWYLACLFLLATTFLILSLHHIDSKVENDIFRYVRNQRSTTTTPENDHGPSLSMQQEQAGEKKKDAMFQIQNHEYTLESLSSSITSDSHDDHDHDHDDRVQVNSDRSFSSSSNMLPLPKFYQPYWNLTCPLELSMFSGIHMGKEEYVHRAWAAREIAERAVAYFTFKDWSDLDNRKIVFIGDSLLRQVFISMACLAWDRVEDYAIPWFQNRQVRTHHPQTIAKGPHSKFEEGRVLLRGNLELVYHHGIGGLLELGEEYHTEETETWIKACFLGKPLTGLTPKYVDWSHVDNSRKEDPRQGMSTDNVIRERLTFGSRDVVLINASVHGWRNFNLQNIQDLLKCKKTRGEDQTSKLKRYTWPQFYYIVTGPSHFPTTTGAFDKRLLEAEDDFDCIPHSTYNDLQVEESTKLRDYLPLIGLDILPLQVDSGHLHIGGKDCLHWMQPGIPDLLAADVLRSITARLRL
jgi:hypothetical protein